MELTDEIYRKYSRNVYQYLLALTHDEDVAEEVTQETFCQAIRGIGRYDGSCKITTWLCAIAKNQLQSYRRKHPQTVSLEQQSVDGDTVSVIDAVEQRPSVEEEYLDTESRISLMKTIHLLREPYREVLYLRIYGGLSFKEIGEVFDKSENWARVSYYRSKEQLKKELESR